MKVWIAVLAILLLVALIFRERYTNYEEALKDVGQTAGYITPKCDAGYTMNSEQSSCEKTKEDGTKETKAPTCPSGSTFTTNGPRGVCEPAPEAPKAETPAAETPGAPTSSTPAPVSGSCPSDYTVTPDTAPNGVTTNYCIRTSEATCPEGYTLERRGCSKPGSTPIVPTCAQGRFNEFKLKCVDVKPVSTPNTTSPAGRATDTTTSSTASVATGGSSGNLIGPTSGGVGKTGKNVWGPVFTGLGKSSGQGGDSTKTNKYPGLLGGMMGKESSRIDGVGIASPSQPGFGLDLGGTGLDMGALPSLSSLGTEANARFLPFSRPGADGDISADPYRLAKSYSTKNLSPQPDPVPFLTDFSAFFK